MPGSGPFYRPDAPPEAEAEADAGGAPPEAEAAADAGGARATLGAVLHARNKAYARIQRKRIDEPGAGAGDEAPAARDGLADIKAEAARAPSRRAASDARNVDMLNERLACTAGGKQALDLLEAEAARARAARAARAEHVDESDRRPQGATLAGAAARGRTRSHRQRAVAGAMGWIVWALALAFMYAVLATDMLAVLTAALADMWNLLPELPELDGGA